MPSINFSNIAIIESIKSGKTGRRLYDDLQVINNSIDRSLYITYYDANAKNDLIKILIQVAEDAKVGHWPIIHIECHGLHDKSGISLANGDIITWGELKPYLIEINVATECNLLIVLAACYGGHMVQIIQPFERAPCVAMLSPTDEILQDEILQPLTAFYRELFISLNLDKLLKVLRSFPIKNGNYYFETAQGFFMSVYSCYVDYSSNPKALKERAKNIYIELKKSGNNMAVRIGDIKRLIKQSSSDYFKSYYTCFFMTDLYPNNRKRFNISYADISSKTNLK